MKPKSVLDERERQEMYRIDHRGLWAMYTLLCVVVMVQLFFGAGILQIAGEVFVLAVISIEMIIAYARQGIWDETARPSKAGNALYAALCAVAVGIVTFGMKKSIGLSLALGAATFLLCFLLLNLLMAYVKRRQEKQTDAFDDDDE